MPSGQLLGTVGLELEITNLAVDKTFEVLIRAGLEEFATVTRDASVEKRVARRGSFTFNVQSPITARLLSLSRVTTVGAEIVSNPLEREQMRAFIHKVMKVLPVDFSNRASFHVHVGFGHSVSLLKKALLMGLAVDPLLFSIAGMGRENRGSINCHTYARPIEAGVGAKIDDEAFTIIRPEMGMSAESEKSFVAKYGSTFPLRRYHPARYFAFNIMSVFLKGTLEYRHFNQTSNPSFIFACVDLVQAITKLTVMLTKHELMELKTTSIYDVTKEKALVVLSNLCKLFDEKDITFENKSVIEQILKITPEFKLDEDLPPISHSDALIYRDMYMERISGLKRSGHISIHNIPSMSIMDDSF